MFMYIKLYLINKIICIYLFISVLCIDIKYKKEKKELYLI